MGDLTGNEIILESGKLSPDDNVVTVLCSDGDLTCSKAALIDASDYVRALLQGNFKERNQEHVNLTNVTRRLLRKIFALHFAQETNLFSVIKDLNEAWELMKIADMFGFAESSKMLDVFICNRLAASNLDETCTLASTYCREVVMKSVVRMIALLRNGFDIQDCSHLNCPKNGKVYCKLATNSQNPLPNSSASPTNTGSSETEEIQLYKFTHKFYCICGYALRPITDCHMVDADNLTEFVEDPPNFALLENYNSDSDASSSSESDEASFSHIESALQLSHHTAEFCSLRPFPDSVVEDYTIATVGTYIYIIGGFYYENLIASGATWRYDTRNDEWRKMIDLKHKRLMHCTAVIDDHIYVCGGYDGENVHNSTEKYDTRKDVWIEEPNMPIGVGNAACTALRDSIYVVCGQFGSKSIQTTSQVQQYDTTNRQWSLPTEYVSPVFFPLSEYGMSCGAIDDVIYVVGGQTVRVDCYNVITGEWKRLANMHNRRVGANVANYRGRLLVSGGYDYNFGTFFNSIEAYDKDTDTWSIVSARLPEHARNSGLCYVFDVER